MANADIIISRAGANTISRYAQLVSPSFWSHCKIQLMMISLKIKFFDKGAAAIFNEVTSNPKIMSNMIINLISNKLRELEWRIKPEKLAR